jgi:poly[(R)-3-hydroxyalkanoate] polymerase subunit PhaC
VSDRVNRPEVLAHASKRRHSAVPATFVDLMFDAQRRAVSESFKIWDRYRALPKVVDQCLHVKVGSTPHDIVYEEGTLRLLHYRNETGVQFQEPLLICYALVNRPYILDLQPQRSVVRQMLRRGFDVYLIDWGVPSAADRSMRLQDYICGLMKNVAEFVCRKADVPAFNLLGYCMGGTMSTIFTALYPELVRNLTLMAAPIDFSGDEALLHLWTREQHFDVDRLIDTYGNCPGSLLQASFKLMKPVQNFIEKNLGFFENMTDEHFVENFYAMERWGQDNIPVAGETFREFVKCFYQRNQLVKGEYRINDTPVKLDKIACPLLLLAAAFDHLVLPASTLGLAPHVRSKDLKQMTINAGHVGLAVSSKAHKQFWPEVADWIAERSTALKRA